MDYKYILFDFDGTLSDSAAGVMASIEKTMEAFGKPVPGRDILIRFVGPPLAETFSGYFGFPDEQLEEVTRVFREFYVTVGLANQKMYDGVPQMLERLRSSGKILAVATSKREHFARQICDDYGITQYFNIIAGSSDDNRRNQKEQVIEYALAEIGVTERSDVLMVGDRFYDVEGAQHCGIDCMGVLYGYGSREELQGAGAKYFAETTEDVVSLILE